MPTVEYQFEFQYLHGPQDRFPGLLVDILRDEDPDNTITIQAHLDTGAEYSLFDGEIATALGFTAEDGEDFSFSFTSGELLRAKRHPVVLQHPELGAFNITIAFSLAPIRRSILGRDFLQLIQVGFREYQQELYITPAP